MKQILAFQQLQCAIITQVDCYFVFPGKNQCQCQINAGKDKILKKSTCTPGRAYDHQWCQKMQVA